MKVLGLVDTIVGLLYASPLANSLIFMWNYRRALLPVRAAQPTCASLSAVFNCSARRGHCHRVIIHWLCSSGTSWKGSINFWDDALHRHALLWSLPHSTALAAWDRTLNQAVGLLTEEERSVHFMSVLRLKMSYGSLYFIHLECPIPRNLYVHYCRRISCELRRS